MRGRSVLGQLVLELIAGEAHDIGGLPFEAAGSVAAVHLARAPSRIIQILSKCNAVPPCEPGRT